MVPNTLVHRLTKVLVDIMFYGGVACCALVPFVVRFLAAHDSRYGGYPVQFGLILLASGSCAVYIIFQLKKMFRTLLGGNPFVQENVSSLRKMGAACFVIALIFFAKIVFWFTVPSTILVVVFAIAGLFCLTLKDLFKQAVYYKEEHDFTV